MIKKKHLNLPSKEQILEVLVNDKSIKGRRDLGRAFGIRGEMRTPFKLLLREMSKQGLIGKNSKRLSSHENLPSVTVLEIPSDANPDEMIAYPINWQGEESKRPTIYIEMGKKARAIPAPGDKILARISQQGEKYYAAPMKILDKPKSSQIGIIRLDENGARLIPIDRKQKEYHIAQSDLLKAEEGDLVEVKIKTSGRMMIPMAIVTNVIGNPQSEGAVSMIALHNQQIPYIFPNSVIKQANEIAQVGIKGREDWLDIPFLTIDPQTAKDHDDAVFAKADDDPQNKDGHIIYVAIADVAAYVTPNSAIDKEAYSRGNSVYFPDRVVPMLPERISNDLCSLIEGKDRPAMALKMIFDASGKKLSHSFHRIMMRSRAKLSYQQAQSAIDGSPDDICAPLLKHSLKPLWAAYEAMAGARNRREPLELDLPERKIILGENGMVERVHVPERLEAHRLIEEIMIASNVCAAQTLEEYNSALLYRVHDVPGREKLIALRDFLASLKMSFSNSDNVRPSHFNQTLRMAKNNDKSDQVNEMVLRSQAQAEYSPVNYGHFGLNLDRYAHFTSPIRRYSDLIVHRALISALRLGDDGLQKQDAQNLSLAGQHLSSTERRAMLAERETNDRLVAHFMNSKINAKFNGRIAGVIKAGLFVRLDESGADGFVPASSLGSDYFTFVEDQQAMIGERSGERFRLGDNVEVRLLEVAPMAGSLRFEITSDGEMVAPLKRKRGKNRPKVTKRKQKH
jgi:ribonuclease R